jgi:aryl-alcohol dehydrogenase-like predicted oxidoreductase
MIIRTLGRTGYKVSALGLGGFQFTGQFGVLPNEADAIIDYALAHNINFIDTAHVYGNGESEAIIGRALLRHKDNKPIVCAKVGHLQSGILAGLKEKALDAYQDYNQVIRAIKHSMWIMRVDCLDILLLHEIDREWKPDFTTGNCIGMEVLEDLKKQGVVKSIGVSAWDCSAITKMIRTGRIDVVLVAGGISLINRWMFDELIPAAKEHNVGVIVGGCLGQNTPSLVFKDREALKPFLAVSDERIVNEAKKLAQLYDLADELNMSMVQLAVRYVLSFPEIHTHTLGARELMHVKDNIRTAEMGPLALEYVEKINQIQDSVTTKMKLKEFISIFSK